MIFFQMILGDLDNGACCLFDDRLRAVGDFGDV